MSRILTIEGRDIPVDESFFRLTPRQQADIVSGIAQSIRDEDTGVDNAQAPPQGSGSPFNQYGVFRENGETRIVPRKQPFDDRLKAGGSEIGRPFGAVDIPQRDIPQLGIFPPVEPPARRRPATPPPFDLPERPEDYPPQLPDPRRPPKPFPETPVPPITPTPMPPRGPYRGPTIEVDPPESNPQNGLPWEFDPPVPDDRLKVRTERQPWTVAASEGGRAGAWPLGLELSQLPWLPPTSPAAQQDVWTLANVDRTTAGPDLTSALHEYELARRQGFQGSFMDFRRALGNIVAAAI